MSPLGWVWRAFRNRRTREKRATDSRQTRRRWPRFDVLEDRTLLATSTIAPIGLILVSDAVTQAEQVCAAASPGTIVVLYDSQTMTTSKLGEVVLSIAAANGGSPLSRLAIVTHGAPGQLDIGAHDSLNSATLTRDLPDLQRLRSLLHGVRFDLYACSVASGPDGKAFVDELAAATGAAVFASAGPVGTVPGSSLVLDYHTAQAAASNELFTVGKMEAIPQLLLPAPSITSVNPAQPTGSASTQPFTINGANFVSGCNVTLRVGGSTFANRTISSFSSTSITINPTFTTVAQTWTVEVINPNGQTTGQVSFNVVAPAAAPSITSVSPPSMLASGSNQTLTINGSNFQNGATLTFVPRGGAPIASTASKLTVVSSGQINYQFNNGFTTGTWTVQVINPDGQSSGTANFTVTALAQVIRQGVDYSVDRPSPSALKAAGYDFVVRYVSPAGNAKNITPSEAQALQSAGIDIILVFESTANRMLDGFAAGVADANTAVTVATAAGAPQGFFCYFACDFDASQSDQAPINAYLDGAASALGSVSRVGFYGGYGPVKNVLDAGKATKGWQTAAWSGGIRDSRISLFQHAGAVSIAGGSCDIDDGYASDLGQWSTSLVGTPGLNVSASSLTLPTTTQGTAGAATSFTVSGSGLGSGDTLNLLAPTGSEISKNNLSGFVSTFPLNSDASGNLSATTVYIRTSASGTVNVSGNLTITDVLHSSLNKSIPVSGAVQAITTPVINLRSLDVESQGGTFTYNPQAQRFEASGTILLGMKPSNGNNFVPLLAVNGAAWYNSTTIHGDGVVSAQVGSKSVPLFSGTFDLNISQGISSALTISTRQFQLAGLTVGIDNLTIANGQIILQASVSLPQGLGGIGVLSGGFAGIIISPNGIQLSSIGVTLPDFDGNLLGLLPIKAHGMSVQYDYPTDSFIIHGSVSLPTLFNVTADFTGGNSIQVQNGIVSVVGDFSIGTIHFAPGWTLETAKAHFDTVNNVFAGSADLQIPGPTQDGFVIHVGLGIANGKLSYVEAGVNHLHIPLGTTGAFLEEIDGSVKNLDNPAALDFYGHLDIVYGPEVTVGSSTYRLADLQLSGDIDSKHLHATGQLDILGGSVATGTASIDVNWANGSVFTGSLDLDFLSHTLDITGALKANSAGLTVSGTASLNTPAFNVGVFHVGSYPLTAVAATLSYVTGAPLSSDYVEASAKIDLPWVGSYKVGARVTFDKLVHAIHNLSDPASQSFAIPASTPWFLMAANWQNNVGTVPVQVVAPDGRVWNDANFDNAAVGLVSAFSAPTTEVVGLRNPAAGNWTISLPTSDSANLGTVQFNGLSQSTTPAIKITSVDRSGTQVTVHYIVQTSDPNTEISLFYTTDNQTGTGLLIASGLMATTGDTTFTWDISALPSGQYYVSALVDDTHSPIAIDQLSTAITVGNLPPALALINDQTVVTGTLLSLQASASDPNNDQVSFSLDPGAPPGISIDPFTGVFNWQVPQNQAAADYSVTVRATDNGTGALSAARTFTIHVLSLNKPPLLGFIADHTIDVGQTVSFSAAATDPDGDTLTYSLDPGAPAAAAINPQQGTFTWTPGVNQGPGDYPVTVRVSDSGTPNLAATQTFSIHVSDVHFSPSFSGISDPAITYGTMSTTISGHLNANAGALVPAGETVQVALNNFTQAATLDNKDDFSTSFNTSALGGVGSLYAIRFDYAGDANFNRASADGTFAVAAAAANHFSVSAPASVTFGNAFNLTVIALDQFNNTATGYAGTVHFTSSDGTAALPTDVTLAGGTGTLTATLKSAGSQTLTATDSAATSVTGTSNPIKPAPTHFVVTAPASSTAGDAFVVMVAAEDQFGSTTTGYAGNVHFSSNDAKAWVPPDMTLANGLGFFATILKTAGSQSLTAVDKVNSALTGTTNAIVVSPAAVNHFGFTVPANAATGVPFPFTVTALDPYNNVPSGYTGAVHFMSNDGTAMVPADSTLTNGMGTFTATLKTVGGQLLIATDIVTTSITGTSSLITTRGLMVNSLLPTPTGFVAQFNKPFDPTTINLYDALGTYGPGDVSVVGPSGPMRGSMLFNPANTSFTFIKTGVGTTGLFPGIMPAGTYTVTFRSAADGFKDTSGGVLDGNNDGTPGDNYVATFTVTATATPVLSIPDFARGPDGANNIKVPNNTGAGVPITLRNAASVTDVTFLLDYNPALLNISNTLSGTSGTFALVGTPAAGVASFSFHSAQPLTGTLTLGQIVAQVPNSAATVYKGKEQLHLDSILVNGSGTAMNDDGVHVVAYAGDASGDASLSPLDAAMISRVAVVFDTGFAAYRLADPAIIADLNGNGFADSAEVTLMNRFLAGITVTQIPPIPAGLSIAPTGPDPTLSLPANLVAVPGEMIVVPLNIDTARPLGSTGLMEAILALRYDPKVFTVSAQDVHLGTLPASGNGWKLQVEVNALTGEIGIDLFGPTPIVRAGGGSLVTLTLHVLDNAPAGASGINLVRAVNPTGQRQFVTTASDAAGPYILHPAVTDDDMDHGVDGQLTILESPTHGVVKNSSTLMEIGPLNSVSSKLNGDAGPLNVQQVVASLATRPSKLTPDLVERVFGNRNEAVLLENRNRGQPNRLLSPDLDDIALAIASDMPSFLGDKPQAKRTWLRQDSAANFGKAAGRWRHALASDLFDDELSGSDPSDIF
ncbi:MAG TPA: glycoside hydrolase domain-containing protein [Gemmataceae bacterium]|nr:glycoside hydrolase domain-containing protein [Gemmataceae bacterium]